MSWHCLFKQKYWGRKRIIYITHYLQIDFLFAFFRIFFLLRNILFCFAKHSLLFRETFSSVSRNTRDSCSKVTWIRKISLTKNLLCCGTLLTNHMFSILIHIRYHRLQCFIPAARGWAARHCQLLFLLNF